MVPYQTTKNKLVVKREGAVQITLCLLIDIARKTNKLLYIGFIDYIKVYDRVEWNVLLQHLADRGCGNRFLPAKGNTLKHTSTILGNMSRRHHDVLLIHILH